jgi:hypothetical protein
MKHFHVCKRDSAEVLDGCYSLRAIISKIYKEQSLVGFRKVLKLIRFHLMYVLGLESRLLIQKNATYLRRTDYNHAVLNNMPINCVWSFSGDVNEHSGSLIGNSLSCTTFVHGESFSRTLVWIYETWLCIQQALIH